MKIYKLQHPADLISRMFILEYMKDVDKQIMYDKANKHLKEAMFYKYSTDDGFEGIDLNWEYLLFTATLHQLSKFMQNFEKEVLAIEEKRKVIYEKAATEHIESKIATPVDINLMDLAQTEINKMKDEQQSI